MNKHFTKVTLFISTLISMTATLIPAAYANHQKVPLGTVQVAGSGCKDGVASTRYDRKTGHLIIAPEDYVTVIENGSTFARKNCSFQIPFQAIPNRAVRLRLPRLVGVVALDQGATAEISYDIFFTGQSGDKTKLMFSGEPNVAEQEFDEVNSNQSVVFECGKAGIIRGNSTVLVQNSNANSLVALAQIKKFGIKIDSVPCDLF